MSRYILVTAATMTLFGCDAVTPFEPAAPDATEQEPTEPEPTTATIAYVNVGTSYEAIHVYAVPCSATDWGDGISVSIYPGETYELTVDAPECYDLAAAWSLPTEYTHTFYYGLEAKAGSTHTWRTQP